MKKIFALLVVSFACVFASTVPAKAESTEVETKIRHEPTACVPNGGSCMNNSDQCCSGICESCGAAYLFCRARSCQH